MRMRIAHPVGLDAPNHRHTLERRIVMRERGKRTIKWVEIVQLPHYIKSTRTIAGDHAALCWCAFAQRKCVLNACNKEERECAAERPHGCMFVFVRYDGLRCVFWEREKIYKRASVRYMHTTHVSRAKTTWANVKKKRIWSVRLV